jgi:hypothetical protein
LPEGFSTSRICRLTLALIVFSLTISDAGRAQETCSRIHCALRGTPAPPDLKFLVHRYGFVQELQIGKAALAQ